MKHKFINLDSHVSSFFENDKVIKLLHALNINTMDDLYRHSYNEFVELSVIDKITLNSIKEAYEYLNYYKELNINIDEIKQKLRMYYDYKLIISENSDLYQLTKEIQFRELIKIYQEVKLSDRDKINVSAALKYIIDNILVDNDTINLLKMFNLNNVIDNNPFDTISPKAEKFNSYQEAYDYIVNLIDKLDDVSKTIFKMHNGIFMQKHSFEEIGNKLSISKKLVKQINDVATKNIYTSILLDTKKFNNSFTKNFYIPGNNVFLKIICEALLTNYKYHKISILENDIYVQKGLEKHYQTIINKIIDEIDKKGLYDFSQNKDNIELKKLFYNNKYLVKNEVVYQNKKNTLNYAVPKLMEEIGTQIYINDTSTVLDFYNTLELKYNVNSSDKSSKKLEKVLLDTCVLCGPQTYIHEKFVKRLENEDIIVIFNFINKNKITSANQIYLEFEDIWTSINIYDDAGVYGYMKYFYPNNYNYGEKNFLISTQNQKANWGEFVIEQIKTKKSPVSYEEISSEYSAIKYNTWNSLHLTFDDLVSWGDNRLYCKSELHLSEEEMNIITIYIFNKKIVNIKDLFSYLLLNHKYILEKNHIYNEKQLKILLLNKLNDIIYINNQNNNLYFKEVTNK